MKTNLCKINKNRIKKYELFEENNSLFNTHLL